MNSRGEGQALRAVKVCFDSASARARSRVEMNAYENCVPIGICNRDSCAERNEHVAVARHDHTIAGRLKNRLESLGDIEIHHALGDTLSWNSATIKSAVTGINDNGSGLTNGLRPG